MFRFPYLLLKQRLQTVAAIIEVEIDAGQEDIAGALKTVPLALFRFAPVPLSSYGRGRQQGVLTFEVKLITENYQTGTPRVDEAGASAHYEIVDEIHRTLDGQTLLLSQIPRFAPLAGGPNDYVVMNALTRVNVEDRSRSARLITVKQYQSFFQDRSNDQQFTKVVAGLEIDQLSVR